MQAFGSILNLVPLAESVVKLTAVCMECFREAAYTKRLGLEKEVEVIGGADKYHSVCRLCYFKKSSAQAAGSDNKLSGAGAAGRGLSCQEALCLSASPTIQLCQLRGPGACQLLPRLDSQRAGGARAYHS